MIKVLNILSDSNIGGAGRLLVNYLHNFDRSVFDIKVILPRDSQLKPHITDAGYEVLEIDGGRDKSFDMKATREIQKIIKEWKPDIVHTHSAFSGKLAAFLCGVPCRFYTRHSAFKPSKKLTTFPGRQINGFVNNTLATDIVAVAQAAADNLTDTGVDPAKITVIINGVDEMRRISESEKSALKEKLGISESTFVCGISARLEDYKGHSYLLDSAKTVITSHPDTVFLIIGCGSCEESLKKQASDLGIADKVIFTGFVDDVAPYYNIMDLNLNCSWGTETSCLALSEGMSLSVPAIATDYGGNPYMITDGVNGYIVPEKNSAAMAEKIIELIGDRAALRSLSVGAREMYDKKFTAKAMTKQLEELYIESYKKHKK
ncbi:MAG: glycosyltransferase [Ruminococcaceae bacterium]|nr:glycosyltransferase [Oscillospiraceae bacterium]